MLTAPRLRSANCSTSNRRLIGSTSNILLLGFLAGEFAGYSLPGSAMTWVAGLTLLGLAASVFYTMVKAVLENRARRRASDRVLADLERRMEQFIPQGRMIAHGTHSHTPHNRPEAEAARSEVDGIPDPRQGRKIRVRP